MNLVAGVEMEWPDDAPKAARLLGALLRAGVDPNEPLRWKSGKRKEQDNNYSRSLVACVLAGGPEAEPALGELLDDPRLSDRIWHSRGKFPPVRLEEFVAEMGAFWAEGALAGWRRWRARRAWISAVLRAALVK